MSIPSATFTSYIPAIQVDRFIQMINSTPGSPEYIRGLIRGCAQSWDMFGAVSADSELDYVYKRDIWNIIIAGINERPTQAAVQTMLSSLAGYITLHKQSPLPEELLDKVAVFNRL
jgi:hypothetical protein